jgi:toxin ParE1/3/4
MAKVILRQEAIDDLSDIWEYTFQEWSENQADKYYEAIKFACNEIGKNPNIGRIYAEISKNLLGLKSGKHIIFYCQISENEIEVIRILHERMDLKNRINE